jgi:prepilin-type N-terminal cleavage/methylation domain-containing protein
MRRAREAGFTLIELLIVIAIIAIITALATAGLLRSKAAANEASAIQSMRITSSSQNAYAIACGRGAFAASYLVLGTPPPGGGAAFISTDLGASGTPLKSGYQFAMVAGAGSVAGPTDCNGTATLSAFYASAIPLSFFSGARSFATTPNGAIWQLAGGTAPAEPFGAPSTMIQ